MNQHYLDQQQYLNGRSPRPGKKLDTFAGLSEETKYVCVFTISSTLNLLLLINFSSPCSENCSAQAIKGRAFPKIQLSTLALSFQPALSLPPTNLPSWACPSCDFWANLERKHWVRWILPAAEVVMRILRREEVNEESQSNNRAVLLAKPAKQMKKKKASTSMQRRRKLYFPRRHFMWLHKIRTCLLYFPQQLQNKLI